MLVDIRGGVPVAGATPRGQAPSRSGRSDASGGNTGGSTTTKGNATPRAAATCSVSGTVAYMPIAVTASSVSPGASCCQAWSNADTRIAPPEAATVTRARAHATATTSPWKPMTQAKGTAKATLYQGETQR